MQARFFFALREAGVPVSLTEYLGLMAAMDAGVAGTSLDDYYTLARCVLVKDERHLDRFDRVFGAVYRGLYEDQANGGDGVATRDLPQEWLRKLAERLLTEDEKAQIEALGGFDALMDTLRERLRDQRARHQGGNKWIGTAGTSPFGAYGYNPEGVRIGQDGTRHRRAVKVWDQRTFRNLDADVEIGTRTMKVALRRLRRFARTGAATELDLPGTIDGTARNAGHLDLQLVAERHNAVKVLLLLDIGGSMDDHVRLSEQLFAAARSEFKHLHTYYFHNCVYEGVWADNRRRHSEQMPTDRLLNSHGPDTRLVIVGDASMSPYEITMPGGSVEHWNAEPGQVWLQRLLDRFPKAAWLNPTPAKSWRYTQSTVLLHQIIAGRMFPLTLDGLDRAMHALSR